MMRRNEETARIRCGNTLRFPRARAEPPRSQSTLSAGSHHLRFPAGVYVYFLRWFYTSHEVDTECISKVHIHFLV